MLSNQDGGCGICEESPNRDKALDVDHNHDTGEVRGLLCNTCNRGLGMLGDDVATLKSAIDYLEGQNGSE